MKYIKWFLVSSFLILFLGICDVVNALDITSGSTAQKIVSSTYDRNYNGYYIKDNLNLSQAWTHNFDFTNLTFENQDYFIFNMFFNYYDTITSNYQDTGTIQGNTQTETTNSYYYCNNWTTQYQVYADGTRSSYQVCTNWQLNSNFELVNENTTTNGVETTSLNNKIGLQVDVQTDNAFWTICQIQNDYNGIVRVVCPINSSRTSINRLRIRYTNLQWGEGTTYASIGIANIYNLMRDSSSVMVQEQEETNNQLQDMNDNITSTDISGASQDQSNIVNNPAFQDNTGLSGIITAPLSMISSLTNQCQPIQLTLPYLKDTNVSIPCMGNFLQSKVPALVTLIKVFVNGFICYLIGLDLFKIVKNARDPDDDRIEVLDL